MAKHTEKHFDGINTGNLDKIISYMCLKLPLRVNFNVYMLPKWSGIDKEAKIPGETCTYVVERCVKRFLYSSN